MKKFSISQLEIVRINPTNFAKSLKEGTLGPGGYGRPKSVRWLDSVGVYHRTSSLTEAINSLERSFSNRQDNPKNRREVEQLVLALINYVDEYNSLGYAHLEKSHNIEIELSSKVKITGWIWLLNMTQTGGRTGYMVTKNVSSLDWESELRFPIIQDYIANSIYGCELNDVEVGVIDFMTGRHYQRTYTEEEIVEAFKELSALGQIITNIL